MPMVGIVVINWNNWPDTAECLDSLGGVEACGGEVFVVDNGSTDDSVSRLRERFPDVCFIEEKQNLGFGGAANRGMEEAKRRGHPYAWILNNDTLCSLEALRALLETADAHPDVALFSPVIHLYPEVEKVWFAGGRINPWTGTVVHETLPPSQPSRESFLSGCSLLIRLAPVLEMGGFHEPYFLYFEDADLCMRVSQRGLGIMVVPSARIWHKEGATTACKGRSKSPLGDYYDTRNGLYFIERQMKGLSACSAYAYFVLRLFRKMLRIVWAGDWRNLQAVVSGLSDYRQRKFGAWIDRRRAA